jgi:hypothetical protein
MSMSHSYKKTPYCSCKKNKFAKNQANRKIRRNKDELYQNREFRKVYDSWDICDYGEVGISFEEYWRHIEAIKHQMNNLITEIAEPIVIEALKAEGINKSALLVFNYNEAGNAFWDAQGLTARNDVTYRNKVLTEMVRIDT